MDQITGPLIFIKAGKQLVRDESLEVRRKFFDTEFKTELNISTLCWLKGDSVETSSVSSACREQ
jgi:hypothetical protein